MSRFKSFLDAALTFRHGSREVVGKLSTKFYAFVIAIHNIAVWFIAYKINEKETSDLTILRYNVDFGNSQVGSSKLLYLLPLAGLLISVLNYAISVYSSKIDRIFPHLLLSSAYAANAIILTGMLFIYFLNFHW